MEDTTMKKILFTFIALSLSLSALHAQRVTSYTRSGQSAILDLNWNGDNYGTIQWQQSTDNGKTWSDIKGATSSKLTTSKVSSPLLYRAQITGDPACPVTYLEREVKPVNFSTSISSLDINSVEMEVTGIDMADANIAEYGYCYAISGLSRPYELLPLNKVGDSNPGKELTLQCKGLRPNMSYNIRFYVKTEDGSIIYGPGKVATTLPGFEWSCEGWTITKTSIRPMLNLVGASTGTAKVSYGTSLDAMESISCDVKNGQVTIGTKRSLKPGTKYYFKAECEVDGLEQTIIKEISTLPDYSSYEVDNTVMPVSHKIDWGTTRVLTKIAPEGSIMAAYPRVCRIGENELLLTYHGGAGDFWQNCYYRISRDNGKTWGEQVMIFDKSKNFYGSGFYRICNPQATKLANGWVILSATADANPETNDNCKTICIISKDNCRTWGDPIVVCRGRGWEPHVVQLPNGDLELLVSSEAKWWQQGGYLDQEIVSARSTDNGETWSATKRASFLGGTRDGMPVPIVMQGNKGVLFSIESPAGGLVPSFVHRDLNSEWDIAEWDRREDTERWATGLNGGGGGPYCVQLPTGEIVVSCHTNQAGAVWQTCRPQVGICDNTGHNMKYKTLPATTGNPLASNEGAYYNSLFVKDAETIWLLTSRTVYNGETCKSSTIEYIEGKIVPVN